MCDAKGPSFEIRAELKLTRLLPQHDICFLQHVVGRIGIAGKRQDITIKAGLMLRHKLDKIAGGAWLVGCHENDRLIKKRALDSLILHQKLASRTNALRPREDWP